MPLHFPDLSSSLRPFSYIRALIQRVSSATVHINNLPHASIGHGMLILLGIADSDSMEDVTWLASRVAKLRIFSDAAGLMNLSLTESGGAVLLVSQFTLLASTKKGNRPSFLRAARPEQAIPLFEAFRDALARDLARSVATGVFGADMQVSMTNDGPVTIWMDSAARE